VLTVVLPSALPGIVSGCLLAVARAAGETAPLLFTIGAAHKLRYNNIKGSTTALHAQIFDNAQSLFPSAQRRGWAAAFTLVALAFIFSATARILTTAYRKRR
jgi:phosphate transport system permease protein